MMAIKDKLKELNRKIELKTAAFLTILGFLVTNVVTFEGLRTHDLESVLASEHVAYDSSLRDRDKDVASIMPDSLDAPLLIYPRNRASLVTGYIRLQWREGKQQSRAQTYTLEVIGPDSYGNLDFAHPMVSAATDPSLMSNTMRVKPGPYLWRVKRGGNESDDYWSSYFYFENFSTSRARIEKTETLTVGTFLSPQYDEVACPYRGTLPAMTTLRFDNVILDAICTRLAKVLRFHTIKFVKYPTADTLVFSGVKDGNVDLAISALSDTSGRKKRGVIFSREYLQNHLVLASNENYDVLLEGSRVGVVRGGTNAEYARELSRRRLITVVEAESLEELLRMLGDKDVSYIITDEPVIDEQIRGGNIVVLKHLTQGWSGWVARITMSTAVQDAEVGLAVAVHDSQLKVLVDSILDPALLKKAQAELYARK